MQILDDEVIFNFDKEELFKRLLKYGHFPDNNKTIPPFFSSERFGGFTIENSEKEIYNKKKKEDL